MVEQEPNDDDDNQPCQSLHPALLSSKLRSRRSLGLEPSWITLRRLLGQVVLLARFVSSLEQAARRELGESSSRLPQR